MKAYRHITASLTMLGLLLGGTPALMYAAPADEDTESISATLLCSGAFKKEADGTVTRSSAWVFNNYSDTDSVKIDRVRIFDREGVSLYDAMPPTVDVTNGVDPSKVGPHNTVSFSSNLMLGNTHPDPKRPLQFILDWSSISGEKILTLDGYVIRNNIFPDGTPRGYFTLDCRTINVIKKVKN